MSDPTTNDTRILAEFVDASPFAMMQCDEQGRVVRMNAAIGALLDSLRLPRAQAQQLLPEDYVKHIGDSFRTNVASFSLERRIAGRVLDLTFTLIYSQRQVCVIVSDKTDSQERTLLSDNNAHELEMVSLQVREAQAQLVQSEKMASLGQLIAGIAHEINTPIGSINSNNDILIRCVSKMRDFLNCSQCPVEVSQDPEVIKIMGILEDINRNNRIACDRIISIIRSLKNFARLDEGERKRVNIHDGIDSSLVLVHHQLKGRIQVVKDYGELPEIECFPNRLNQVFMNILVNAEQAMPNLGTLTIATRRLGDEIVIKISDTGIGIPKENLQKIFDQGFTTKGVGVGTGLGLSICRNIIEDHHGRIAVESEVGKGTTFTITLPVT
jgi:signal transduction histidine kinase